MNHPAVKSLFVSALLCLPSLCSGQDTSSVWDGVYSAAQASRGEAVYRANCISCHGQDLGGNSNSPGLTGMGFMFLWEGRTLGEFFETIRSDMPTDRPGGLPQQDYLDVVAYILQKNDFPAADSEIPTALIDLDAIAIGSKP